MERIGTDSTVVTSAYLERKEVIGQNITSVQDQDCCSHLQHLVIWDGISNLECIDQAYASNQTNCHLQVRYNHDDYGDYIRRLGTRLAIKQNSTAVTYLDADNYWSPDHWATVYRTRASSQKVSLFLAAD